MKRPKGAAPSRNIVTIRGDSDLFDVDYLPALHSLANVAEDDVLLSPEAMVWRLRDAFTGAIVLGVLIKTEAPPAEHRDYLARIAAHAEALSRELGVSFANNPSNAPNIRQATGSHGFQSLTQAAAMAGYPVRDTFHWMLYARLIAPDVPREQSDLSQDLWTALGTDPPSPEEANNLMARRQLRETITRAVLALPLLADVARFGEKQWASRKADRGQRPDQFRRSFMAYLAVLYRNAYGRPPALPTVNASCRGQPPPGS